MSKNAPQSPQRVDGSVAAGRVDRRIRRTRDALGNALVALLHEKPLKAITVQQVLDRADIGRSTFYTHYRDKNDLFLSDIADFFDAMSTQLFRTDEMSYRVVPVRELFAHVGQMQDLYAALVSSGKSREIVEMGQEYFARGIEKRLANLPPAATITAARRTAVAHALAGAFMSLMVWWIDHQTPGSPEEMDDLYHRIVWSGIRTQTCRMDPPASRLATRK